MQIRIFDTTHGFCACLIADNGNVMLFDCGHNELTGFRPSLYLPKTGCSGIEHLIIQNFDQDHISDLCNLRQVLPISRFFRNQSIPPEQLRRIKMDGGPLTDAMETALTLHQNYIYLHPNPPTFPDIEFERFNNLYPLFTDTNNLSLVSFIHYDGIGIIFPGDIEKAGWQELLKNASFREHLGRTNIFIASHHGRTNGYCEEVFSYCHPDIIIISDKSIMHDTQIINYAKHSKGIPWTDKTETRYVFTTRSDGNITITKNIGTECSVIVGEML